MHQHALQTAMSLYESGTLTLETAARQAGVEKTRLVDSLARRGREAPERSAERGRERRRVAAD
jgi:predicted HTH domain antitoxin